jgi:hypothetical protein
MNQQKIVENEDGEDTLPKKKTFLQRIDHPLIASVSSLLAPVATTVTLAVPRLAIDNFLYSHFSKQLYALLTSINLSLWIFLSAWGAGLVLGTWMPKSIKKAILWTYGLLAIPFHIFYNCTDDFVITPYLYGVESTNSRLRLRGSEVKFTQLFAC